MIMPLTAKHQHQGVTRFIWSKPDSLCCKSPKCLAARAVVSRVTQIVILTVTIPSFSLFQYFSRLFLLNLHELQANWSVNMEPNAGLPLVESHPLLYACAVQDFPRQGGGNSVNHSTAYPVKFLVWNLIIMHSKITGSVLDPCVYLIVKD